MFIGLKVDGFFPKYFVFLNPPVMHVRVRARVHELASDALYPKKKVCARAPM